MEENKGGVSGNSNAVDYSQQNSHNVDSSQHIDSHNSQVVDSHNVVNNHGYSLEDFEKLARMKDEWERKAREEMKRDIEEKQRTQNVASVPNPSYSREVDWSNISPLPGSEQYRPHQNIHPQPQQPTPVSQPTVVYTSTSSPKWPIVLAIVAVIVAAAVVIAFVGKGAEQKEKKVETPTEVVVQQSQPQVSAAAKNSSSAKKSSQTTSSTTAKSSTPARQTTTTQQQTTNSYSSAPAQTVEKPQTAAPKVSPFEEAKTKADAGDAASCYKVAMAYKDGDGVSKNLSSAFSYMKAAADKGYTPAYIEVAKMYHGGRGVTKDRDAAEHWYKKAADAGNNEAKRILLNM